MIWPLRCLLSRDCGTAFYGCETGSKAPLRKRKKNGRVGNALWSVVKSNHLRHIAAGT